jgi:hypothetical protein
MEDIVDLPIGRQGKTKCILTNYSFNQKWPSPLGSKLSTTNPQWKVPSTKPDSITSLEVMFTPFRVRDALHTIL